MKPRYPTITVPLSDQDGNAMSIIGRVGAALKQAGVSREIRAEFAKEAMSGDYDHVLQTVMAWVETE